VVADLQGDACVAVGRSQWGAKCGTGMKLQRGVFFFFLILERTSQVFELDLTSNWLCTRYRVLKKSFTMVFQMLLCGKCYENVYT
jgi:hypothetical protein